MTSKWTHFLTLVLATVLLASCSSTKKKAQESLQAGSYEDAVRLFDEVLRKDPNDVEAQVGLRKAHDGVIDKQLISVRMARIAGNQQQALDLLMDVISKEQSWKYSPHANVAFTQSEESDYAVKFIQDRIQNNVRDKKPLQGENLLVSYRPLFQDDEGNRKFEILKKSVNQSGRDACRSFQQTDRTNAPYFADFLSRFCGHFAETCRNCAGWSKTKLRDLYQRMDVAGDVTDLPDILKQILKGDLRSSFEQTPWYDPQGGQKASLQLSGSYRYSHDKALESLTYNYTVQVPYQATETVQKTRLVPYQEWQNQYDSISRQYRSVPVTRYRSENYTDTQVVTRYRSEPRVFPYNALHHKQKISLILSANSTLGTRAFDFSFSDSANREGYEHTINMPDIGLRPSTPNLLDPTAWVTADSARAKQQAKDKLTEAWVAAFCTSDSDTSDPNVLADRVQQCLRAHNSGASDLIKSWYDNQLGVTYDVAEKLLSQ